MRFADVYSVGCMSGTDLNNDEIFIRAITRYNNRILMQWNYTLPLKISKEFQLVLQTLECSHLEF